MEWTKELLARYFGRPKLELRLEGISEDGLKEVFQAAAMERLKRIEVVLCNEYLSDQEKLAEIAQLVEG